MQWVEDCTKENPEWKPLGYIDDNPEALLGLKSDYPLLGSITDWQPQKDELYVCGIAAPQVKRRIISNLKSKGAVFTAVIHPTAIMAPTADIGEGVVLCPYSAVNDNAIIGDFVLVNMHSSVTHDAKVGAYSTLSYYCGINGKVTLGEEVFLGSHALIVPGVTVGDRAFLCAGSVVLGDIAPGIKVIGNPAKEK